MFEIFIKKTTLENFKKAFEENIGLILVLSLGFISVVSFMVFYFNGLGLSYNDARSHLDIGRRVVESLKPGLAQLGSVWLPLNHILMIPFIWNDFLWHSGLAGAIVSMVSYIFTGIIVYKFLQEINIGLLGRLVGVLIFALNLNVLYLQSTAMTELLLIATSTAASYYLLLWSKKDGLLDLIKAAFFATLAVLTRYDGWFLLFMMMGLIFTRVLVKKSYREAEGVLVLFMTLGALGIVLWLGWNQLIFKDALYFALGPYSAHAQQEQLAEAGNLSTKGNIILSTQTYFYALSYTIGLLNLLLGFFGAAFFLFDKKRSGDIRWTSLSLSAPLIFNILALFLGFSVLFIQGLFGNTWFNVRYGIIVIPLVAIFIGYLIERLSSLKVALIGLLIFSQIFSFTSFDAVTIDDARVGASQKNVSEVSSWLNEHAKNEEGFVLIAAASHDAIIFSSGLDMSRFIQEGTGKYWDFATKNPSHWAKWIIMRTYDNNDATYRLVSQTNELEKYELVGKYPFADIYELKDEYLKDVVTEPILGKQK